VRILYLGLPLGALALLGAGHRLVAAAIGHPDAPGMSRLRRRAPRDLLLLGRPDLEDVTIERALVGCGYDALLSWFWPRRIPASLLACAPRGAFGTHPSLLPRWRGPDPYFHAIAAGDRETGVTLHRLDTRYDTGAIVAQIRMPIMPRENAWSLARRLDRPALALLVGCADALASGLALEGTPQDEAHATEAPQPDEDALALRFAEQDAEALDRRVRAAAPEPGATALLADTLVVVERAVPWEGRFPGGLRPGEAFFTPEGVVVRCARGGLRLGRVRVVADDRLLEGAAIKALWKDQGGADQIG
jgi:methionyl-tRNA formyltransferase